MQLQTVKLRQTTIDLNCLFMKYFILFVSLFLFNFFAKAQVVNNNRTESAIGAIKTSNYIIGIGNPDQKMFLDVFDYTKTIVGSRIYAVCETQQVIGITVRNNEFKSYDVLRDLLLSQFPTLMLFRKDDSILNNDCKNEILK